MPRERGQLIRDVKWGIGWGLYLATGFSIIALALGGFRGSIEYPELGLNTPEIVAIYYVIALVGGTALGILRPFTNTKLGGFLVGSFLGFLAYGGSGLMIKGVKPLQMLAVGLLLGVIIGGSLGYQTVPKRRKDDCV